MTITQDRIFSAVQSAIVEALGLAEEEVTPSARLIEDLGAESIDLLDMLFRVERKLGIKIKSSELAAHIRGGIPEEQFMDEQGVVTPLGMAQLQKTMPQIDADALAGKLEAERIITLVTVQNIADVVAERAAASAS